LLEDFVRNVFVWNRRPYFLFPRHRQAGIHRRVYSRLVIQPKDVFETFRKYRTPGRSEFVARVVAASLLDCPFVRARFGMGIRLLALGPPSDSSGQKDLSGKATNQEWVFCRSAKSN